MFPVQYDYCNWKKLSNYLQGPNRERIPPLTRAKLLHDSWNLAYANELCFGVAMNMTLFLQKERNHVVWEPMFTMIHHIGRRIEGLDVYLKFEVSERRSCRSAFASIEISAHVIINVDVKSGEIDGADVINKANIGPALDLDVELLNLRSRCNRY